MVKITRVIEDDTPDVEDVDTLTAAELGESQDPDNFPALERPETVVHCSMMYGDVVISVVDMTPALALHLVRRHNTRNRRLRPSRKNSYARDMLAGDWMFNGDSVGVAEDGTLMDGQHRLEAVVESQTTQPMLLVEYLPIEAQLTKDIGAMRSMGDQLAFKGYVNPTMLGAVARRLCFVLQPYGTVYGGGNSPTRAEMRKFVETHTKLAERAVEVALRAHATKLPAAPSVIGSAYFLAAQKDQYAAELFFVTKLIEGVGLEIGEPAHALQRRLQKHMGDFKTPMPPEDVFRYAIHAWNHWRDGKAVLARLQKPAAGWPPYSEMVVK